MTVSYLCRTGTEESCGPGGGGESATTGEPAATGGVADRRRTTTEVHRVVLQHDRPAVNPAPRHV